ncbi:MAG: T9SS type A sorting domain-containing protein [Bacteroidales bacterium]|nr:T9SS type A sorting domain-containing protein [Bacteroidales bacterium]
MRKIYFLFISVLILMLGLMPTKVSAINGNLTITHIGTTQKPPMGDWLTGIGETGRGYTINTIDLAKLITANNGKVVLAFDNFTINGGVELNFTGTNMDIDLTLLVTSANGKITVNTNSSITILTDKGKTSTLTLTGKEFIGMKNCFKVDHVIFSDMTQTYDRIEMPGFTNWKQEELDKLIAAASHIGSSITELSGGYKANDFTTNTKFTVENGVFTMTAEADFSDDKGMGFKNMDREGTLAGKKLGAYPADFFKDLTGADGIRFKVDVNNGSAGSLNIGLSNCREDVGRFFEYFIYNIPLTAADDNGYVTLPLSLFEKEFWSNEGLQLDNCIVFIIEIIDVKEGTSVSFSDFHAYKLNEGTRGQMPLTQIYMEQDIKEVTFKTTGNIYQPGTASQINLVGNINMIAKDITLNKTYGYNHFSGEFTLQAESINIMFSNLMSDPTTADFTIVPPGNLKVKDLIADGTSQGAVTFWQYKMSDNAAHSLRVILGEGEDVDTTLTIAGETEFCEGTSTTLTATSTADSYSWTYGEILLSDSSSVVIPDSMPAGQYAIKLVARWLGGSIIPEDQITITKTIDVTINKTDHVELTDTVNVGETYNKNGFDVTPTEAGTTDHTLTLTNANGCDSVVVLHLTAIIPEGIHDFNLVRSIYPNPATNYITVQVSGQAMGSELRLYDMQGRLMKAQIIDNETVRIDLTSFANGLYLLKADSQTVKIIKQ